MYRTSIGRLRIIAIIEGISYLLLLGVAMPLKYLVGMPLAVKVAGWAHGVLYVFFCMALLQAMREHAWGVTRGLRLFVASLIPFGTFYTDRGLRTAQSDAHIPRNP